MMNITLPPDFKTLNKLITKEKVEAILNYVYPIGNNGQILRIRSLEPYQRAFVHRSFPLNPDDRIQFRPKGSNERSEFLGDKFLGAVIAYYLTKRYPDEQEGFLTRIQSRIVRGTMLHKLARFLGLGEYLLLAPVVERLTFISPNKGRNSPRLYEDVFESLCGAIIEDFGDEAGYPIVKRFVLGVVENQIDFAELILQNENHKDTLQRYFQRLKWPNPQYEDLYQNGPSHTRSFTSGIFLSTSQLAELDKSVYSNVKKYHNDALRNVTLTIKNAILKIADKDVTDLNDNSTSETALQGRLVQHLHSAGIDLDDESTNVLVSIMSLEINKVSPSTSEEGTDISDMSESSDKDESKESVIKKFLDSSMTIDNMSASHSYYLIGIGNANKKLEAQQLASRQALANLGIDVNWNV